MPYPPNVDRRAKKGLPRYDEELPQNGHVKKSWHENTLERNPPPPRPAGREVALANGGYNSSYSGGSRTGSRKSSEAPTLPRRTLRGDEPRTRYGSAPLRKKKPKRRSGGKWTTVLLFAIFACILALIAMCAAFGTDHWTETMVNRDTLAGLAKLQPGLGTKMNNTYFYRNSYKGFFQTCYQAIPGRTTQCFGETAFEIQRSFATLNWGPEYETYIHLMRLMFMGTILAIVFELLALMGAIIDCMRESRKILLVNIGLEVIALLCMCLAMGAFHGINHFELYKLKHDKYPADWPDSHPHLAKFSWRIYGYSYILGWVGVFMSLVALVCFIVTYVSLGRYKKTVKKLRPQDHHYRNFVNPSTVTSANTDLGEEMEHEANSYYTTSSGANRNFAYDMVEYDAQPKNELDIIDDDLFSHDSESTHL